MILDPRSGQAASNSSPRRRAGSEISLFQPRPAEKKESPLKWADFPFILWYENVQRRENYWISICLELMTALFFGMFSLSTPSLYCAEMSATSTPLMSNARW